MWCIPVVNYEFIWRMEDILDLYETPYDPKRPKVCFDERPYQLIEEICTPLPMKPGRVQRIDYTYKRNGVCNLFLFFEPQKGWRHVKITDHRTKKDYAYCMKDLVDIHFPDADKIIVVEDNLNTHTPAALYETFQPQEARRILRKLEFHHTPKHASWLNQVEIEISVLTSQCIGRRIPDKDKLKKEVVAWQNKRNDEKATINWQFTNQKARVKLKKLYPA